MARRCWNRAASTPVRSPAEPSAAARRDSPCSRDSRSFTPVPSLFPLAESPMKARWLLTVALVAILSAPLAAADAKNKRLLLVTDSGGFVHDSVGLAEEVLKDI